MLSCCLRLNYRRSGCFLSTFTMFIPVCERLHGHEVCNRSVILVSVEPTAVTSGHVLTFLLDILASLPGTKGHYFQDFPH